MELKAKLMLFTAATALSANMGFAAINADTLAEAYRTEGYSYVEVKVGPTQTKLEAVKGDRKVEVIYDNASGDVIESEFDDADVDEVGRTGIEIEDVSDDFADDDDRDESENDDGKDEDDADDSDEQDDEEGSEGEGNDGRATRNDDQGN